MFFSVLKAHFIHDVWSDLVEPIDTFEQFVQTPGAGTTLKLNNLAEYQFIMNLSLVGKKNELELFIPTK